MSKLVKILGSVIILLLLGFYGYSVITADDPDSEDLALERQTFEGVSQEELIIANEADALLRVLNNLTEVKLDGQIFNDPAFTRLVNNSKSLDPIDNFRRNPFAPIGEGDGVRVRPAADTTVDDESTSAPGGGDTGTSAGDTSIPDTSGDGTSVGGDTPDDDTSSDPLDGTGDDDDFFGF